LESSNAASQKTAAKPEFYTEHRTQYVDTNRLEQNKSLNKQALRLHGQKLHTLKGSPKQAD